MPLTNADLVVEDGTGLANANTYVSRSEASDYHRLLDNAAWAAASEHQQVAALINATQYVDLRFRYAGELVEDDPPQALAFPREDSDAGELLDARGIDVSGTVPVQIKQATMEYALRALADALMPDLTTPDDAGRFVTLKREKLGPLEEETRYSAGRGIQTLRRYPEPDRILRLSGLCIGLSDRAIRA